MSSDEQFCPECDIRADMHDEPGGCDDAKERIERLEQLERLMFGGFIR